MTAIALAAFFGLCAISGGTSSVSTSRMILAAVNDTVTVDIAASGATSTIEGDADRSFLQCAKLR